ncbi:hypothetical protein Q5752_002016 [Cryptotrichosporon argae]
MPLPPPCPRPFSDHVYAVKSGVSLSLRFWPATTPSSSSSSLPPFVLYAHGGAFAAGKHHLPNPWVVPGFRTRGFAVVSFAYRFAPAVSLADMVSDGADAHAWVRAHLSDRVDAGRCVLVGESAGGTIAALLAPRLSPVPVALVDIYGVVDFTDPKWAPDAPRHAVDIQPLSGEFSEEAVRAAIEAPDAAKALTVCPFEFETPEATVAEIWGVDGFKYDSGMRFQYDLKRYMRTHNTLVHVILRITPDMSPEQVLERKKEYSALYALESAKTYPPTYLLHGDADPVVPISNAYKIAARLRELGVDVGESYEPGVSHEFDHKYTGPDVEGWDKYIVPCLDFVERHAKA